MLPKAAEMTVTSDDRGSVPTPNGSRPTTPLAQHLLSAKSGPKGASRRARKAVTSSANVSSGEEDPRRRGKAAKGSAKRLRKWDADGLADEDDGRTLDYSTAQRNGTDDGDALEMPTSAMEDINPNTVGTRTEKGQFVLKDLDNEVHSILQGANAKKADSASSTRAGGMVGSGISAITGLFRNVIGGKMLTKEDLDKAMKGMETHLLNKNIAQEAVVRLCEGVERELIGVKTGSFESMVLPSFFICPISRF